MEKAIEKAMEKTIVEYVRDENRNPRACLVGKWTGSSVRVGVSICHAGVDKFDKSLGRKIAEGRCDSGRSSGSTSFVLHSVGREIDTFADRCRKYFQTNQVEVVV